jgi:hypothetical protein
LNAMHYFRQFHDEAIDWSEKDNGWLLTVDRPGIEIGDCLLFGDRRRQWFEVTKCDRLSNGFVQVLFIESK